MLPKGPPPGGRPKGDPRWAAVDKYTLSHLHPSSRENHAQLEFALKNSEEKGLPPIFSSTSQSKFLALQCKVGKVKHVLEIGTLGAYTPIFIATENPDVHVTTLELSPECAEVARENIANAGVSDRVTVLVGSAVEILPKLLEEIEAGKRERFGLTYIDADKINCWTYFDFGVKMGYPGACVVIDNMVQGGRIASENEQDWEHVQGQRKAIEAAGKDTRVDAVVMQTVSTDSYDGYLFAVVK